MYCLDLLIFFLFILKPIDSSSSFQGNITVENQLLSNTDVNARNLTLSGIVTLNSSTAEDNTLIVNTNQINCFGLEEKSLLAAFSLDDSGKLFFTVVNNLTLQSDVFTTLYANIFYPLDTDTLSINNQKNNTQLGLALNTNNVNFQASTINLNTPEIKAIVSNNTINIMEHLTIEKKLSTNILAVDNTTDSNNIKITSLTIPGTLTMTNSDLSMNSETGTIKTLNGEKIALSANTVTVNSLSSGANESLYASLSDTLNLITMPPLGLNEQEQLVRLPSFQPYAITFPDLRATQGSTYTGIRARSITLNISKSIRNTLNTNATGFSIRSSSNSNSPTTLEIKKKVDTINILNLTSGGSGPSHLEITFPLTVTDSFETNKISSSEVPAFSSFTIKNANIKSNFDIAGTLTFQCPTTFSSLFSHDNGIKILTDRNREWIIGTQAGSSERFKKNIETFLLSKEEFIAATKLLYKIKEQEYLLSLNPSHLQRSPLCGLAIEYDTNGEPLYYDHCALLAIAASQLPHLKEEIEVYKKETNEWKEKKENFDIAYEEFIRILERSNQEIKDALKGISES